MTHTYKLLLTFSLLLAAFTGRAQYSTPTQDGTITAEEYNKNSFTTATGGTWYMTWDANYLYIAKTGGGAGEPDIVYLDLDPTLPVTGGGNNNGNTEGEGDYGVRPALPFRADARVYFSDGYIEVRRKDNYGGFSTPFTNNMYTSPTGTNREIRIGWDVLTGGGTIPPSFNWLGYVVNGQYYPNNYRYDQAPTNPASAGTLGGPRPPLEYYYTVASTANGSATNPFLLKSYTFPNDTNTPGSNYSNNSFGGIDVWDFTMNTPNQQISRAGGNWNIGGSLVVGNGILYFGSGGNYGTTNVGNVRVTGGILNMNQTNQPLNVREDVMLTGGQFVLSGTLNGDLNVGRDFMVQNGTSSPGTFQPNQRSVTFTGSNSHTITASGTNGYILPFSYLRTNTTGNIVLNSSIIIINELGFGTDNTNFVTGNNVVILADGATLANETVDHHVTGQVQSTQTVGQAGSGTRSFGNIGFSLTPQNGTATLGQVTVTRTTGSAQLGVGLGSGTTSISRRFTLSNIGGSITDLNLILTLGYRLDELNGISEGNLALYESLTGTPPYLRLTSPPSANPGTHTLTYAGGLTLSENTVFTLADGTPTPLPVTLASFEAAMQAQGTALLRWRTASELNSKGFGIERQLEGSTTWQPVGYQAATNRPTGSSYEFTDASLPTVVAGLKVYYRLRQEDTDGTTAYSPVVVLARPAGSTELTLSPVPVSGGSLTVTFAEASQEGLEVAVTDVQGRRVLHLTTGANGEGALHLPVEHLAAGVYVLSVQVPGQAPRRARFVRE